MTKEIKQTKDIQTVIDELAIKGVEALNEMADFTQEQVDHIVHHAAIAALDKQTVNKDYELGMALLIPKDQLVETFHAPDEGNGILKTWCAKLKPGNNGYRYQVYAGWELGVDDFSKREEFIRLVDTYADYLNHPVSIHIN